MSGTPPPPATPPTVGNVLSGAYVPQASILALIVAIMGVLIISALIFALTFGKESEKIKYLLIVFPLLGLYSSYLIFTLNSKYGITASVACADGTAPVCSDQSAPKISFDSGMFNYFVLVVCGLTVIGLIGWSFLTIIKYLINKRKLAMAMSQPTTPSYNPNPM